MKSPVLIDTGPLVAFLRANDAAHQWCEQQWRSIRGPLLTCEAVIAETCFLLERTGMNRGPVFELLHRQVVRIEFSLAANLDAVRKLVDRYANVPMSLADACLVRMAEECAGSVVFTLDSDFRIYRKNRRQKIPTLMPE